MIGQVDLEDFQAAVDGIGQAEAADQQVHGPEATGGEAAGALADFIVNVAGRHHGFRAAAQIGLVQAALDPALAVGQLPTYAGFHSKLLGGGSPERDGTPSQTTKTPEDFEFFHASAGRDRREYASLRPSGRRAVRRPLLRAVRR